MTSDPSLEDLQRQIESAKAKDQPGGAPSSSSSSMGGALRLSLELVASIVVGCAIGYFLDQWLGTKPWLFILCFFLGCAAGFKNMLREAQKMANEDTENK